MGEVILTVSNQKSDVGWKILSYKLNEVGIEAKFNLNVIRSMIQPYWVNSVNGVFFVMLGLFSKTKEKKIIFSCLHT